ncbi:MAG: DNA-directed RNA polymerase subunit N [Thermodesulfovibrionia bacterium]|nr:DNA-directed RNA polymerase subunit N [Thermodesulfovibrionia bacterium]
MIIPIRCFTCGNPVARDWENYCERVSGGESPMDVMNSLGYDRYCCRRMFLSHCELIDEIMNYKRF